MTEDMDMRWWWWWWWWQQCWWLWPASWGWGWREPGEGRTSGWARQDPPAKVVWAPMWSLIMVEQSLGYDQRVDSKEIMKMQSILWKLATWRLSSGWSTGCYGAPGQPFCNIHLHLINMWDNRARHEKKVYSETFVVEKRGGLILTTWWTLQRKATFDGNS